MIDEDKYIATNEADVKKVIKKATLKELYGERDLLMLIEGMDEKLSSKKLEKTDKGLLIKRSLDLINAEIKKRESKTSIGAAYE